MISAFVTFLFVAAGATIGWSLHRRRWMDLSAGFVVLIVAVMFMAALADK